MTRPGIEDAVEFRFRDLGPGQERAISENLMLLISLVAVLAIFLTTDRGRRWARGLGLPVHGGRKVPAEDRDFLLAACKGDPREVALRLKNERELRPALDEAQLYRRAIRRELRAREGRPEAGN